MARKVAAAKKTPAPAKSPRKKAVNGSQKGAAFERLCARQLSLWLSDGLNPDLLWRSASSGARSTVRRKKTGKGIDNQASDLTPVHKDAEPLTSLFVTECKCYRTIGTHMLVYGWDGSLLHKWWERTKVDALSVGKLPMLVAKENMRPPIVLLPYRSQEQIRYIAAAEVEHVILPRAGVVVFRFEDLVRRIPFHTFHASAHAHLHRPTKPVPGDRHDRSSPDGSRRRRVPLAGV